MLFESKKSQKIAVILAMVGAVTPLSGFHKFYLRQPWWGIVYLMVSVILMPRDEILLLPYLGVAQVASFLDGIWYFWQSEQVFEQRFNGSVPELAQQGSANLYPYHVEETAQAIRQLDQLRAEGLLSEYEFEQQRRQLVEGIRKS